MAVLLYGAVVALLLMNRPSLNFSWLGAFPVVVAAIVGCIPAIQVLMGGAVLNNFIFPGRCRTANSSLNSIRFRRGSWCRRFCSRRFAAIYGVGYLRSWQGSRALGPIWFFYGLLVLGMVLVLLARNAVLFLVAWELMAVASFFLVTFEHERESVREAGWIYFVATHLGTAFLLAFFLLLARETGSMDFDVWAAQGIHTQGLAERSVSAGGDRVRHQGRLHAAACVAAGGASGGTEPCLGPDVGRDDQDGNLRIDCARSRFWDAARCGGGGDSSPSG